MDFENECTDSALRSFEVNDEATPEWAPHVDGVNTMDENNGNSAPADSKTGKVTQSTSSTVDLPPSATRFFSVSSPSMRGHGLKKWKRVRRDSVSCSNPNIDCSKILKRASSSLLDQEVPHLSYVSSSSVGSARNSASGNSFPLVGSHPDPYDALGSSFALGMNSEENNVDGSSKSSNSVSAQKSRHDFLAIPGISQETKKKKNLSSKAVCNSVQQVQLGKGRIGISKKPAGGDRVKISKENSHSSGDSDSGSSNSVSMQGASSSEATINGKQNMRPINHGGDVSEEVQTREHQFSKEHQTCSHDDDVGKCGVLSQDDFTTSSSMRDKDKVCENHSPSSEQDPLDESAVMLQSVQEALEQEVEKLGEMRRECGPSGDAFFQNSADMEGEVEAVLRQKMEAEVELLVITQKLGGIGLNGKVSMVKGWEMRKKKVCRATSYFFIQLALVGVALGGFFYQLLPCSTVVVPT